MTHSDGQVRRTLAQKEVSLLAETLEREAAALREIAEHDVSLAIAGQLCLNVAHVCLSLAEGVQLSAMMDNEEVF